MNKFIGVIMMTLILVACGNDDGNHKKNTEIDNTNVELSMPIAEIEDDDLIIAGITSLPDRTILNYELSSTTEMVTGLIEVNDGAWDLIYDVSNFSKGPITAWVSFNPDVVNGEQPAEIYEKYGDRGDKITSDQKIEVYGDNEMTRVSIEKVVEK